MNTSARLGLVVAFCLAVLPGTALSQLPEIHSKHFLYGYPAGTPATNDLIIRDLYALSSNDGTRFADWVAYRLTTHEVMGTLDLERDWRMDPFLAEDETLRPGTSAATDPYGRPGNMTHDYDRGHLAPLASFKGDRDASSVNFYSNIVPQHRNLNQGPWQRLEQAVRDVVCTGQTVWVMTGPYYDGPVDPLPNAPAGLTVPSGFWKIVGGEDAHGLWVAAFDFAQSTARNADIEDHLVSVDDVEGLTGLDFFWQLDDVEEAVVEGTAMSADAWEVILPDDGCPAPVR